MGGGSSSTSAAYTVVRRGGGLYGGDIDELLEGCVAFHLATSPWNRLSISCLLRQFLRVSQSVSFCFVANRLRIGGGMRAMKRLILSGSESEVEEYASFLFQLCATSKSGLGSVALSA